MVWLILTLVFCIPVAVWFGIQIGYERGIESNNNRNTN